MSELLLVTLNARYIHAAAGLRYLYANLAELREKAAISEFEVSQDAKEIAESILSRSPSVVGFGVYIWNVAKTTQVISLIRRISPHVIIVVGGPEVSYEIESQVITSKAHYVVTGEADHAFRELCRKLFAGELPAEKVVHGGVPDLATIELPYEYYSEHDLAHRVVYIEASRGCPFTCEFCLSSIDIPVRQIELPRVLEFLQQLFDRGARTFKFVDRTFNLNMKVSTAILQFFLDRMCPGLFAHFEMVPDRFPPALREIVKKFPPGSLQFEVGIQSFDPEVGKRISRRQDFVKVLDNLAFLRRETGVHIHADLIAGLPGETLEGFGRGFDQLVAVDPHEIQVGILKRLKGTPIVRHDDEYKMVYAEDPPYEVLSTSVMTFTDLQRIGRFSRYWDLVWNSGNFVDSRSLLVGVSESPFEAFMAFSDFVYERIGKRSGIQLKVLTELVFGFLVSKGREPSEIGPLLAGDYARGGRSDFPGFLQPYTTEISTRNKQAAAERFIGTTPKRQARFVTS